MKCARYSLAVSVLVVGFQCTLLSLPLTYWSSTNPEEVALARSLVALWNQEHPGIPVRTQPMPAGSSSEEILLAAVVAKTTPDVCSNIIPAIMNRFIRARAVVALDRFPDWERVITARTDPSVLAKFRARNGHYYQVPWKANPVMLAYNVGLFRQLGISPPHTYAEFMRVADRLTRDTDGDGRIDQWAMSPSTVSLWWQRFFDFLPLYVAATAGETLLKDDQVIFDNSDAVSVMTFFADGFRLGYFPKRGSSRDLFLDGKTGMTLIGPWGIKYFERAMVKKIEVDFVPVPVPEMGRKEVYTYGDPKNIVIFSTTKQPRKAWEFVKFLISKRADHQLFANTDQVPIRKQLVDDPAFQDVFERDPRLLKFAEQVARIAPLDDSPHLVQILDYLGQQYEAAAVYQIISPAEAIRKAAIYAKNIYRNW